MWVALAWVPRGDLIIRTALTDQPLRLLSSVLVYPNGWYQLAALLAVAVFGWRWSCATARCWSSRCSWPAASAASRWRRQRTICPAYGANGAALALLCAWAMRDGLAARRGEPYEGDLLGTGRHQRRRLS